MFVDKGAFTLDEGMRILDAGKRLGLKVKAHAEQIEHTGKSKCKSLYVYVYRLRPTANIQHQHQPASHIAFTHTLREPRRLIYNYTHSYTGAAKLVADLGGLSADHLERLDDAGAAAMAEKGVV